MAKNKGGKPTLKAGSGESGSIKEMKKALKRGGGGGKYLKRIPADGFTGRFLLEPPKWQKFWEHYDESRTDNRYFPCTEDCEGCDASLSSSKRWLAPMVDVAENRVELVVLPASLVGNLLKKYDKFHTMLDRDYELTKEGTGFDTEYDALYEQPKKMKLDKYEIPDLEAALLAQLDEPDEDDDDEPKKDKGKKSKAKGKSKEEPEEKPKKRTKEAASSKKGGKPISKKDTGKKPLSKKK